MEYTIGETSERVGLSSYTLRFYEKEGLIPNIKRNKSGIRIYDENDIFWIDLVRCLRDTGMTLTEIRRIVNLSLEGSETVCERKEILIEHKEKLLQQLEDIKHCISKIDKKLDWYDGKENGCSCEK